MKNSTQPTYQPMLASSSESASVKGDEWLYELKWDGFRALAYCSGNSCRLRSRNDKSFDEKFYPVNEALEKWGVDAVVDGEIVVIGKDGLPDFAALQSWRSEADGQLVYFLFDLLWLEGRDLTQLSLEERRDALRKIVPETGILKFSEAFDASAEELFKVANGLKLEGIIAKKRKSKYLSGKRSASWKKIKAEKTSEAVIGGYTRNENSKRKISALLLGVYENGELVPVTPVGTGFTDKMQDQLLEKFGKLKTTKCPFNEIPDFNKPSRFRPDPPKAEVTWLRPELVAEVSYRTLASDGSFRHPSFKRLRDDIRPKDVKADLAGEKPVFKGKNDKKLIQKIMTKAEDDAPKTLLNPKEKTQVRTVKGKSLKFTNLDKVFWPEEGYTKRDMLNYYYQISEFILPHIVNRPQTLNRFPNGYKGKSFYQKDVKGKAPACVKRFPYYSEADEREKEFMVCNGLSSLLYMVNLGCIEINPWSSRVNKPDHPDWCIIDLDPDRNPFEKTIEAARVTMDVLRQCEIPFYCKTSGSTGLHIYIPLGAKYTYEDSKELGRRIVTIVHRRLPKFTSIERMTSKRKGKIYLDFLQNRPQATVSAAYSLRPKPGATVSMPLFPEEVKKGLKLKDFTIANAVHRARELGDIFAGVNGKGILLKKVVAALEELNESEKK